MWVWCSFLLVHIVYTGIVGAHKGAYKPFSGGPIATLECDAGEIISIDKIWGCRSDSEMKAYFMEQCSGKQTCTVDSDQKGDGCWHLNGGYNCYTEVDCTACSGPFEFDIEPGKREYMISGDSPCGKPVCPLTIKAQPGQGIRFRALDLTWDNSKMTIYDLTEEQMQSCTYTIEAKISGSAFSGKMCGGYNAEQYYSGFKENTPVVDLTWSKSTTAPDNTRFNMIFSAEGCPLPDIPHHGWMMRVEDSKVVAGCFYSDSTWLQRCEDDTYWDGPSIQCPPGNCPDGKFASTECTGNRIVTYENGQNVGCCDALDDGPTYCEDGSIPVGRTYSGCPNGFIEEEIGTEIKCCPIYGKHPECPAGQTSVPMEGNFGCSTDASKIFVKKGNKFWAGCCKPSAQQDSSDQPSSTGCN